MKRRKKEEKKGYSAKKIAMCAMLSALGVIFLSLGSLVEVLYISMAVLASLLCIFAVIEYGKGAPWMIYAVTSTLALILPLPSKTPVLFYAAFFGFYPILKEKFEKRKKLLSWILKEITFNVCFAIIGAAIVFLFGLEDTTFFNPFMIAVTVALAEVAFVLYDIVLTRLITIYLVKLRKRFKFK